MRTPNSACEICGKKRYRRPSELKKAKHICCKTCRSILYKKFPEITKNNLDKGRGWNKGMSKANGDALIYGKPRSEATKQLISQRMKEVLVKKGIFISCEVCGKKRYVFPSEIKRGKGRFCSKRCIALANNLVQKDHDTDIEQMMEAWLIEEKVTFEKQKAIDGISIPDFFVRPNICIYCDGDYWHNLPRVKKRDSWINHQLEKEGYKIIRLMGSEIKAGVRPLW